MKRHMTVGSAIISDEHKRLNEMLSSILFFIQNMRDSAISPEAIDLLSQRMRAHFDIEEHIAKQGGETYYTTLHHAHDGLMSILDQVKACQAQGDDAEGKRLLTHFTQSLERHDIEVDVPLFAEIARKH